MATTAVVATQVLRGDGNQGLAGPVADPVFREDGRLPGRRATGEPIRRRGDIVTARGSDQHGTDPGERGLERDEVGATRGPGAVTAEVSETPPLGQ